MKWFRARFLAAVAAFVFVAAPVAGLAAEVNDGQTPGNGKPFSGEQGAFWDNAAHRLFRGDSNGNLFIYDRARDDWQTSGLNLRNNQPINTEFTSQVLDLRKFSGAPMTLLISWPGDAEPLYVGLDLMYSSSVDSTTIFRFPLGGSNPRAQGQQLFRTLIATPVMTDSTAGAGGLRHSYAIPLADSVTRAVAAAPYGRVHIWTDGSQVNGVYAHVVGRP